MSKSKYKHMFEIDRATWVNGHSDGSGTSLLNNTGGKCCIGFLAQSCGVKKADLIERGYLSDLDEKSQKKVAKKTGLLVLNERTEHYDDSASNFYSRNDCSLGTRKHREQKLTTMFAERGIKVKFTGKYPEASDD